MGAMSAETAQCAKLTALNPGYRCAAASSGNADALGLAMLLASVAFVAVPAWLLWRALK